MLKEPTNFFDVIRTTAIWLLVVWSILFLLKSVWIVFNTTDSGKYTLIEECYDAELGIDNSGEESAHCVAKERIPVPTGVILRDALQTSGFIAVVIASFIGVLSSIIVLKKK